MAAKAGVLGQDVLVAKRRPPGACPPAHTAEHRHHSAHLRGDRRGAAPGMAARLFSLLLSAPLSYNRASHPSHLSVIQEG